ncbi:NADH-quinone oxidoreductase subunit B family protein [uncultured Gilliamella sp.]|uniref:NADH-quinone oxidoreductase subunit B family protein n=1 Tax=uncultured Gilliamella sp. TaxID=1193505 RepID=UPI0025ECAAC2|nr:NADH-quinone oxidoreductase subunit B family protein [uncultured Gilliamella sp.]
MNLKNNIDDNSHLHYTPKPIVVDEQINKLKETLLKKIKRSAYVYRVDCGGCNGCEIEIFAAITPLFDAERFGIKVVPSPRHADILLFTGAVTRSMRMPALRAYHSAPDPKICISYGACGCGGGIFHDLYCVWGGSDKIVPIDVYIPGCPPTPAATIYGFALALGLLEQKLKGQSYDQTSNEQVKVLHPHIPVEARVVLEREARKLVGYYQGKQISDKILSLIEVNSPVEFEIKLKQWLDKEQDLRLNEVVNQLQTVFFNMLEGEYHG